ncbi:paired amphipathic helix protein Sin3a-like isoform X2 [Apostichopus japonicus]|uniref:paired amphipathic helix protein Sin3a-like isoform X2 n=1 Tax=Stichopus japonicus TaxID=307972 RepID=UPI003AB581E7
MSQQPQQPPRRVTPGAEVTTSASFPQHVLPQGYPEVVDTLTSYRRMPQYSMNTSGGQAGVHAGPVHHPQPHPPGPPQASTGHPQQAVHPAHPTQPHIGQVLPLPNIGGGQSGQPPPQTAGGQPPQQQYQRLKVEDALSYLDQVKLQFGSQPQVYNDFLDIMKEFKSQSIDTPGVINRVSNLFKGHPDLIVGFNTFLPPGYKIEVHASDPTKINFTTPNQSTPKSLPLAVGPPPNPVSAGNVMSGPPAPAIHSQQSVGPAQPNPTSAPQPQQPSYQNPMSAAFNKAPVLPPVPSHSTSHAAAGGHTYSQPPLPSAPHPNRPNAPASQGSTGSQPVEFNHAINYVNKIKNRFQGQPEIYKAFLEILHTYQKEQRAVKESQGAHKPTLSETQVFDQVAKLFKNQEDLLQEFGQFLPDANGSTAVTNSIFHASNHAVSLRNDHDSITRKFEPSSTQKHRTTGSSNKRSALSHSNLSSKKQKASSQGVSMTEARKYGTFTEFIFFEKVRKAFKSQEVYENFLRCLVLFNQEIVSRGELVQLVTPFLGKYPEHLKWFKEFLGYKDIDKTETPRPHKERSQGEMYTEIDFSNCKRCGASYRALPKSYTQPKCSGRNALCTQVINDTWVSFPSWSEDSTFVTSRKTQYEEHIYRCEDERYELDIVIEVNTHTIRVLEHVNKKLSRLSPEEQAKFKLDNCLGGTSEVLHRKAIQRIYGDKAGDIIEGLKKNPAVAVPLVLKRLKLKDDEWREAQRSFNKIWREQNEKYYLKSLDHQGLNFKQNDVRQLRSKSLLNDIETIFDERQESDSPKIGPHLNYTHPDKGILEDVAALIIHHAKRQTGIHKEEKQKIKQLLHHFLPDFLFVERGELSDDEDDDDDEDMETDEQESNSPRKETFDKKVKAKLAGGPADKHMWTSDNIYHVFFTNNNWYLFFRLYTILCERLLKMKKRAEVIAESDGGQRKPSKVSTAVALGLKTPLDVEPEGYYSTLLEMVRNVLDGNMESSVYEDQLREMFGIHAYLAFTLDKVVQNIVRQLQNLVVEDTCLQITDFYLSETGTGATGGTMASAPARVSQESAYQRKVEQLIPDENCFKVTYVKRDKALGIELLDTEEDHSDDPVEVGKWVSYMQKYVSSTDTSETLKDDMSKKAVFLRRNLRQSRQMKESLLTMSTQAAASLKEPIRSKNLQRQERADDASKRKVGGSNEKTEAAETAADPSEKQQQESFDNQSKKENGKEGATITLEEGEEVKMEVDSGGKPVKQLQGVEMVNNMECKFNLNSYRMVYVVDSEDYMYRRSSLKKAREAHQYVTEHLAQKFDKWHNGWKEENVTEEQENDIQKWFDGDIDGLVPCTTIRNDYTTHNGKAIKYSVVYPTMTKPS